MELQDTLEELEETLSTLEEVLASEFKALKCLDAAGIENATSQKLLIDAKLRSFGGQLPDRPEVRESIVRLRSAAQVNQALLIHARACLKGAIETANGGVVESISFARPLSESAPVRINLRG
jgi:hypothetical protein